MVNNESASPTRLALQAFFVWLGYMVVNVLHHGTVPFVLGADLSEWVYSPEHLLLTGFLVYGMIFLVVPLILVKGWPTVRKPAFLIPLLLAVAAATLWSTLRGIGVVILVVLLYLHWRYDLSELGIRSSGWRGDVVATLLVAGLYLLPRFFRPVEGFDILAGLSEGAFRLFGNPATSAEYFFYFGFLATRFSKPLRPVATAIVIGLMYMLHEMTNPEYWYEEMLFGLTAIGVSVACGIYLWRRALPPIWFGDGLARIVARSLI